MQLRFNVLFLNVYSVLSTSLNPITFLSQNNILSYPTYLICCLHSEDKYNLCILHILNVLISWNHAHLMQYICVYALMRMHSRQNTLTQFEKAMCTCFKTVTKRIRKTCNIRASTMINIRLDMVHSKFSHEQLS